MYDSNCNTRTREEQYIDMVESAEAIYMSGGQSGRVQSCLFGQAPPTPPPLPLLTTRAVCEQVCPCDGRRGGEDRGPGIHWLRRYECMFGEDGRFPLILPCAGR